MSNFPNSQSFEETKNQIESELERLKLSSNPQTNLPRYTDKYNITSNLEKLSKAIYFHLLPDELKNRNSFLIEKEFSDEIVDIEVSEEEEEQVSEDEVSMEVNTESEFEDENVEEFFN